MVAIAEIIEHQRHQPLRGFLQRAVESLGQFLMDDIDADADGNQPEKHDGPGERGDQAPGDAGAARLIGLRHLSPRL
ncbi:hypothetical protein RHSP_44196 [Rhizobium freirei PRF 81]|uniref:Uncharacterized protein n=1 Tax=Rhizobium freirei PRF 81 TaxID=363754 RepID=N6UBH8_9HYPH|nr:hypothetical protein RHSP_44196 [Rhizobium freirei PRF 81]